MEILTLKLARELKGKKIKTFTQGYSGNAPYKDEFIIGDITTQFELAKTTAGDFTPYANQAEYWESYMKPERLDELKNTMVILRSDETATYMFCHPGSISYFGELSFTESDQDRPVMFEITNQNQL